MTAGALQPRLSRPHPFRQMRFGAAAWPVAIIAIALAEGAAAAYSLKLAAALLAPIGLVLADMLPAAAVLGVLLAARILVDDRSATTSHQSASVNLPAALALLLLVLACSAAYRRRIGGRVIAGAVAAFAVATLFAAMQMGVSTLVIREPVREASIVAIGILVANADRLGVSSAITVVQLAGLPAALLALYQAVTHTGMEVAGSLRANGTFSHPNSAAVYFAVAATASLSKLMDGERSRRDVVILATYVAAAIATFSLGGMAALVVMFLAYGALRTGSARARFFSWGATLVLVLVFVATPIGASRLSSESNTQLGVQYQAGRGDSSLQWRIYSWTSLIPEWRRSPIIGQGLGSTVAGDTPTGLVPHNEYIRYLVETGVAGLAVVGFAVWRLVVALVRVRRSPHTTQAGVLGLAIVAGLAVNATVANTLVYTPAVYAAAIVLGAVLVSGRASDEARDG